MVLVLALTACGDDDGDDGDSGDGSVATTTTAGVSSSTAAPTTTTGTATTVPGGDLPGTPVDFPPRASASLAVVGVAADDVLNVRSGPGTDFEVVATLTPLAEGVEARGENRQLPDGAVWARVFVSTGNLGWANTAFLLQLGDTTDETSAYYPTPADRPTAPDLVALAEAVATEVASSEPRSRVTVVDGPSEGDLGEVTVDVLGIGDDSVGGFRLHVLLRTVEVTTLCSRGVDDQRRCV